MCREVRPLTGRPAEGAASYGRHPPRTDGTDRKAAHGEGFPPHRLRGRALRGQLDTLRRVKKTSVYLEPELDEALARRAEDEGITKAEFVRRTLAGAVQRPPRRRPRAVGLHDDGPPDLARRDEQLLGLRA
jgi:hypothetical protein